MKKKTIMQTARNSIVCGTDEFFSNFITADIYLYLFLHRVCE